MISCAGLRETSVFMRRFGQKSQLTIGIYGIRFRKFENCKSRGEQLRPLCNFRCQGEAGIAKNAKFLAE